MKIKIGLVGAIDSVNIMEEVAKEYDEKIEIISLKYKQKKETTKLIKDNMHKVDMFLFSGIVPYTIAMGSVDISKLCTYVPRQGTCLYKNIWQIKEQNFPLDYVSFDLIKEKEIREIYYELGIKKYNIYAYPYEGDIDYEKLAKYHYNLWKNKHTQIAVTSLLSTYNLLKEWGVPVLRITLTKSLIRQSIETAIYQETTKRLKQNQIAILIIKISDIGKIVKKYSSEYEIQKLNIKLYEVLLDYAKILQGSIYSFGYEKHFIFTTRGALENPCNDYETTDLIEDIKRKIGITIDCGIGLGKTAYDAETNANIALQHSNDYDGNYAFMVDDEGNIEGPLGVKNNLTYSITNNDKDIIEIAKKAELSAAYISKLRYVAKQNNNSINSKDMAYYLNVTERSARRILNKLCKANYAKEVGQDNLTNKGRPRKTYEILL